MIWLITTIKCWFNLNEGVKLLTVFLSETCFVSITCDFVIIFKPILIALHCIFLCLFTCGMPRWLDKARGRLVHTKQKNSKKKACPHFNKFNIPNALFHCTLLLIMVTGTACQELHKIHFNSSADLACFIFMALQWNWWNYWCNFM